MKHEIRPATLTDINTILTLTKACALHMEAQGIFQWNEYYPNTTAFENDLKNQELYVYTFEKQVIGTVTIATCKDEEYKAIMWLTKDSSHYYIHRLAVHPLHQGKGIAQDLMTFAETLGKNKKITSIRLDTFSKNERNQRFYEQRGYKKVGEVYFPKQSDAPFYCYELVL